MTTNLIESINLVLKKSRNMLIGALVKPTFVRCNALFNKKGREVTTILASGQVYKEVQNKIIEDALRKENTHNFIEFDLHNTRFLVQETTNLREVRLTGDFKVKLDERWCDCDKFQKLHMPCSHVVATLSPTLIEHTSQPLQTKGFPDLEEVEERAGDEGGFRRRRGRRGEVGMTSF
ncbi:hypothetical protein JHK85_009850 [Glycine max]|nr:hypothetical protein JHK85_009850 [Glycine max]